MTSISGTIKIGTALALGALLLTPFLSYALNRSDTRLNAALMRETTSNQGGTGGSGGTTGGSTGGSGSGGESQNANADQIAAEELFEDLIQNGPNTDELPSDTDLDTEEVTDAVEEIETDGDWESGFITILNMIISRFTNR